MIGRVARVRRNVKFVKVVSWSSIDVSIRKIKLSNRSFTLSSSWHCNFSIRYVQMIKYKKKVVRVVLEKGRGTGNDSMNRLLYSPEESGAVWREEVVETKSVRLLSIGQLLELQRIAPLTTTETTVLLSRSLLLYKFS